MLLTPLALVGPCFPLLLRQAIALRAVALLDCLYRTEPLLLVLFEFTLHVGEGHRKVPHLHLILGLRGGIVARAGTVAHLEPFFLIKPLWPSSVPVSPRLASLPARARQAAARDSEA